MVISQNNSLFTDPKILNFIHNDLEEIKRRKSIAGSRKTPNIGQNSPFKEEEIRKNQLKTKNSESCLAFPAQKLV